TPGTPTVTATDTATSSITGQATITVLAVGPATHLGVFAFGFAAPGSNKSVLVVALDASNHQVAAYTGTVHFTSTDAAATVPADYTFTAADYGRHVFTVSFATTGQQTLTVTDTASSTISGSRNVKVWNKF